LARGIIEVCDVISVVTELMVGSRYNIEVSLCIERSLCMACIERSLCMVCIATHDHYLYIVYLSGGHCHCFEEVG
jgi:hypothetical protein